MIIFSNGCYHDETAPAVPQDCGAFLHGHGVFSTLRLYRGDPRHLDAHVQRLMAHAQALGLPPLPPGTDIPAIIAELVHRNTLEERDARLRISWTVLHEEGWLGLMPGPLPVDLEEWQHQGMSVITLGSEFQRVFRPALKTLNYLPSMLALKEAKARSGCPEALIFDARGFLLEGAISNVFVVQEGGVITTPADGRILAGLTRQRALRKLDQLGLSCQEAPLAKDQVHGAQEIFLTNSVREVVPVVRVDGQLVGSGRPGPLTVKLQKSWPRSRDN